MKKLLSILAALVISSQLTTTVVSCKKEDKKQPNDQITTKKNLRDIIANNQVFVPEISLKSILAALKKVNPNFLIETITPFKIMADEIDTAKKTKLTLVANEESTLYKGSVELEVVVSKNLAQIINKNEFYFDINSKKNKPIEELLKENLEDLPRNFWENVAIIQDLSSLLNEEISNLVIKPVNNCFFNETRIRIVWQRHISEFFNEKCFYFNKEEVSNLEKAKNLILDKTGLDANQLTFKDLELNKNSTMTLIVNNPKLKFYGEVKLPVYWREELKNDIFPNKVPIPDKNLKMIKTSKDIQDLAINYIKSKVKNNLKWDELIFNFSNEDFLTIAPKNNQKNKHYYGQTTIHYLKKVDLSKIIKVREIFIDKNDHSQASILEKLKDLNPELNLNHVEHSPISFEANEFKISPKNDSAFYWGKEIIISCHYLTNIEKLNFARELIVNKEDLSNLDIIKNKYINDNFRLTDKWENLEFTYDSKTNKLLIEPKGAQNKVFLGKISIDLIIKKAAKDVILNRNIFLPDNASLENFIKTIKENNANLPDFWIEEFDIKKSSFDKKENYISLTAKTQSKKFYGEVYIKVVWLKDIATLEFKDNLVIDENQVSNLESIKEKLKNSTNNSHSINWDDLDFQVKKIGGVSHLIINPKKTLLGNKTYYGEFKVILNKRKNYLVDMISVRELHLSKTISHEKLVEAFYENNPKLIKDYFEIVGLDPIVRYPHSFFVKPKDDSQHYYGEKTEITINWLEDAAKKYQLNDSNQIWIEDSKSGNLENVLKVIYDKNKNYENDLKQYFDAKLFGDELVFKPKKEDKKFENKIIVKIKKISNLSTIFPKNFEILLKDETTVGDVKNLIKKDFSHLSIDELDFSDYQQTRDTFELKAIAQSKLYFNKVNIKIKRQKALNKIINGEKIFIPNNASKAEVLSALEKAFPSLDVTMIEVLITTQQEIIVKAKVGGIYHGQVALKKELLKNVGEVLQSQPLNFIKKPNAMTDYVKKLKDLNKSTSIVWNDFEYEERTIDQNQYLIIKANKNSKNYIGTVLLRVNILKNLKNEIRDKELLVEFHERDDSDAILRELKRINPHINIDSLYVIRTSGLYDKELLEMDRTVKIKVRPDSNDYYLNDDSLEFNLLLKINLSTIRDYLKVDYTSQIIGYNDHLIFNFFDKNLDWRKFKHLITLAYDKLAQDIKVFFKDEIKNYKRYKERFYGGLHLALWIYKDDDKKKKS